MNRRFLIGVFVLVGLVWFGLLPLCEAQNAPVPVQPQLSQPSELAVGVNKSVVMENASGVRRVLIGNPEIAEAVAVSGSEVVVNGKAAGDTTLVLWAANGRRSLYDVHVRPSETKTAAVTEEIAREFPGQAISLRVEEGNVFIRGTADDPIAAGRVIAIASTLGKVVNLLNVKVPPAEPQILLKVRFANVDRAASIDLGANFVSTGGGNTIGQTSTQQFTQPIPDNSNGATRFTFSDALNILLFRPDLNVGATIKALQAKQLLEILAEPNLLTMSGKPASFLAGGEFPYPTLQGGGSGIGQITVQFREFGIRVHFLPAITPRGTIRMVITPEVSSLDFANGLTVQGFTVPGLATRRVETEIELSSGQSFAIAGLLDNRLTQTISKIPGLGDIPVFGKLFQSKSETRNRSELLVLVTPEIVDPIGAGAKRPDVPMPKDFMKGLPMEAPSNPVAPAGSPSVPGQRDTLPFELMGANENTSNATPASQSGASSQPPMLPSVTTPKN